MATKYKSLFTPIKVGDIELKNRIVMMPMGVYSQRLLNYKTGAYTKDGADYYIERAKGGTGLIITGLIPVVPLPFANLLNNPDEFVSESKYLMDGVHQYGAKIFIQLTALTGRAAHAGTLEELNAMPAPAPIQNVWDPTMENRGITKDEIKLYVKNFAEVAWLVKQAGGDGVEIHAVHEGYLLDQFVIASLNKRTDEYGGSLENRLRFPVEIVQAIKAKCGSDFPVSLRYSVKSYTKGFNRGALPGEKFEEFCRDIDESKLIARKFQDAGYDMLNCDNGNYDSWYWAHPPVYMPKACNLDDVAEIKKVVDIPVVCAGRFNDPGIAEQAIAAGRVDMMGIGRALLADPEFASKCENGDIDAIRPCICCHQGCFGRIAQFKDISCAVNPACGRENSWALTPANAKKKIAVVGGGLGGMEAARVCAARGHTVDLYERTGELGGVFVAAAKPDFKDDDKHLLTWYKRQIKELGVNVHMNCDVTKDMLKGLVYDELFIATGATERRLDTPGLDGGNVTYAVETLSGAKIPGKNIIVIGGGLTGCEIAYMFGRDGKNVTLVEISETILNVFGLSAANYNMLMELLDYYKVRVIKNAVVESYADGKATVVETIKNYPNAANRAKMMYAVGPEGIPCKHEIPADHIVVSVGYNSENKLYSEIREVMENNVYLIGDAKWPTNVMEAVWTAYEIAKDI